MESDQKRAFLAVVLSGAVLFLWQMFFVPKTVPVTNNPVTQVVNQAQTTKNLKINEVQSTKSVQVTKSINVEEFNVENTVGSFNISNELTILDSKSAEAVFEFKSIKTTLEELIYSKC